MAPQGYYPVDRCSPARLSVPVPRVHFGALLFAVPGAGFSGGWWPNRPESEAECLRGSLSQRQ